MTDDLKSMAKRVQAAREHLAEREAARDEAIRAALDRGESVAAIAKAADLSVPRVYQVRDGRR